MLFTNILLCHILYIILYALHYILCYIYYTIYYTILFTYTILYYTGGKKGTAGVAIGDINDGIEGSDAPPSAIKQKTLPGVKSPHTTSNNTNTIAIVSDSSKEIAAGQLKATADMETGTKQRKINKKLQEYDSNNQDNQPETRKDL